MFAQSAIDQRVEQRAYTQARAAGASDVEAREVAHGVHAPRPAPHVGRASVGVLADVLGSPMTLIVVGAVAITLLTPGKRRGRRRRR